MLILAISDIHGNSKCIKRFSKDLQKADLVIIAGDITNFGDDSQASRVVEEIRQYNSNILAVHGNCDLLPVFEYLEQEDINLHGNCVIEDGIAFTGVGGVLPNQIPLNTPLNGFEVHLDFDFEKMLANNPFVIVTHQPAFNTNVDRTGSDFHGGSEPLRQFIEEYQPILAICGHIHEAKGIDKIGNTLLVNPGPAKNGNYALIEIDTKEKSIKDIKLIP